MDVLSPAYIMLAVLAGAIFLFSRPVTAAVKRAEMDLTADDLKTFKERYRRKTARHDMPPRFEAYAQATDKAGRVWSSAVLAIIVALVWITMAGPGRGLFPYP